MLSQIFAKEDFADWASFKADHTIDICSQWPGTLSIQPFWTDELIRLLLVIYFTSHFEIKLKNSFPSTFKRAIGQKSLMLERQGGFGYIVFHGIKALQWHYRMFETWTKNIEEKSTNLCTLFIYFVWNSIKSRAWCIPSSS